MTTIILRSPEAAMSSVPMMRRLLSIAIHRASSIWEAVMLAHVDALPYPGEHPRAPRSRQAAARWVQGRDGGQLSNVKTEHGSFDQGAIVIVASAWFVFYALLAIDHFVAR